MTQKIIQQGAEAKIILSETAEGKFVIKDRIKKSYRTPELDKKIRVRRTRSETKLLKKASEIINSPKPLIENKDKTSTKIKMSFIQGKKLSEFLDSFPLTKQKETCKLIGLNIGKLHDADLIHGDLTTSNMILSKEKIFFIDFGLGFHSIKIEDKAVDLHLLRQALEAKHFKNWKTLFKSVLLGYSKSKDYKKVLEQFKKVESRGRYKESY